MSPIDYKSQRMGRAEARKLIQEILNRWPQNVRISGHARKRLQERSLILSDLINVLRSPVGKLDREPEFVDGSWRYKVETPHLAVCVAFPSGVEMVVVTAMRKEKTHAMHKLPKR